MIVDNYYRYLDSYEIIIFYYLNIFELPSYCQIKRPLIFMHNYNFFLHDLKKYSMIKLILKE